MRRRRPRELYLEEHVLLAGGQIHLVLVVIHADVDDVGQQLLVAGDHFQLLMETLNSPALRQPLSRTFLTHTPRKARSWAAGRVHLPPPRDHWGTHSLCPRLSVPMVVGQGSCTSPTAGNSLPAAVLMVRECFQLYDRPPVSPAWF